MTTDADQAKEPATSPHGSAASTVVTWTLLVVVGEACLVAFVILLNAVLRVDHPLAYLAALGVATFAGGRFAGIRGWARWLLAPVLIVLVAIALVYLVAWIIVSGMQGP